MKVLHIKQSVDISGIDTKHEYLTSQIKKQDRVDNTGNTSNEPAKTVRPKQNNLFSFCDILCRQLEFSVSYTSIHCYIILPFATPTPKSINSNNPNIKEKIAIFCRFLQACQHQYHNLMLLV